MFAQELGHDQRQIRSGDARLQFSGQAHTGHDRSQKGDGLAEHGGFGFDAADPPTQNAHAIDHGGMRVGAHQCVGIGELGAIRLWFHMDAIGQKLQIHLVADAYTGGHDAQLLKCLLSPTEKLIALAVACKFHLHIFFEGIGRGGAVDLDRMINDQIYGHERLDEPGISTRANHG